MSSSSSFSSTNWRYDVFLSFRGKDVRKTFLSHFLKELDRKLISFFQDNKIEKSQSLDPVLKQAIKDSRIAIVVFSKEYASSRWCLNELLEIVKCKNLSGQPQRVIPVFYDLDPSHVRNMTGDFGNIFERTCHNKTKDEVKLWRQALMDVGNLVGFHSKNWDNEAKLIEAIVTDILTNLNLTPSNDFEGFVGIEDHITKMSLMLDLKSEEVRTVGIWGPSGIGKTTIARALFSRISHHFQGRVFIDMRFISKSIKDYSKGNPTDYNMKLHLQRKFLSQILDQEGIKVDQLGMLRGKLKNHKVLIIIDDLDDEVVLDALAGEDEWFGCGSRIIAITKDKHILRAREITCVYEVGFPSEKVALQMFCQSAFRQNSPPNGFMKLASGIAMCAGGLPLGLNLLGSSMRGRDRKDWVDMLPSLQKRLDGKIDKALRISYDGLQKQDQAIFRHIACFFNGYEIEDIKLMLADSELNVDIGLKNLIDKSLIHVIPSLEMSIIEMHCLVEQMGKAIVCEQSNNPGEREFIIDWKNVRDVLEDKSGSNTVQGISLNLDEVDKLRIHKKAFKKMRNLKFLNIYTNTFGGNKETRWHLQEDFDYLPPKLKFLSWEKYPLRFMPPNFRPENLVKLQMMNSNLEKLWEGVHALTGLKDMDLWGSKSLKEIPDLSMVTNLETLNLGSCSSLVELPSSIRHLNKLVELDMSYCSNLKLLPTGSNLISLQCLRLWGCSQLKSFPDISNNISDLDLGESAIEEFPSNLRLENLQALQMFTMKSGKLWETVQVCTLPYIFPLIFK
ncbi:PREDICTED: disease resistance protein RPS6-like [Camelina sativa]|uniref:Disease resistance protein RPS6-like n=1 Tax=Camelina sativa TaxID=90675 RepID=A0ABM1RD30_CAMSA|nr:PREDICTED: disease resistance protein RPS6-like [Camelina sativa]